MKRPRWRASRLVRAACRETFATFNEKNEMAEKINLTGTTLGALLAFALLAASLANDAHSASSVTQPKAAEPKPATVSAVKASVARLTAPGDLAASESLQNGEGPIEGVVCVAGLRYTKDRWRQDDKWRGGGMRSRQGFTLLSTNAAYLRVQGVHEKFDSVLRAGAVPDGEFVGSLYCQEVAFDLIHNMGTLRLPPFDAASWFVGDFGQDECGDTTVLVLARRATAYFFLTVPIEKLNPPGLACLRPVEIKEGWCDTRTGCIRNYLAVAANQDALTKKLAELTRSLSFSR
jgi:hypothetical protein